MYTYLIRCNDNSIYCGYTTNIKRRLNEHKRGIGSKYTKTHGVKKLELYVEVNTKSDAMKLECLIKKRFSKKNKEDFIAGRNDLIDRFGIEYIRIVRSADIDL